ncbi:MAG: GNAT family N-acetyltransferase, partial [Caulobacterales bacterium]|nr:GNAT family N-acetyltransferase [Caulobacterales bacterium]
MITLRLAEGLSEVDQAAWDRVANPPDGPFNPFISWDFLEALERSGCVSNRTGWAPRHLLAEDETGALLGAAPLYLKSHSRGEFVFDWGWAEAFERAGGRYYPKLLSSAPFTPVTGPRLLAPDPSMREALLAGLVEVADQMGVSSLHVTFPAREEWELAGARGLLLRQDQQFHWINQGYESFEGFLDDLASRKRKNLRKERAAAQDGVEIMRLSGDDLSAAHWDAFYRFYTDTGDRKWGSPYLNRDFFELLHERMREHVVMVLARRDGEWIAGALNILGSDAIYGRYWGRLEERPHLHFELCYHQAIEEAIARGLERVEAGAQGAHKLARGYAPTPVYSYHWIANRGFRDAVARFLDEEREWVEHEIDELSDRTPFKKRDP